MPDHWVLPSGLEESLEGHGAVLRGWAPQAQVLQHKAIGAFLTHYGWNSMLEGHAAGVAARSRATLECTFVGRGGRGRSTGQRGSRLTSSSCGQSHGARVYREVAG
ncbi:hypothetical protein AMTR_s00006p00253480 [Amborella trichopoda]|uniref:Uncharacterized protein n=1 Tax=Amborella trichopoda TaxID=13333 RepID=W1P7C4_AMBTC|nr:hypothetical protein AMTR_s00006p00253480 [Amborella trichopoda]